MANRDLRINMKQWKFSLTFGFGHLLVRTR